MIAAVVPVKRGKIALSFFDYEIPESLVSTIQIGHLVEITLRSKKELGIVKSLTDHSNFKNLKPVNKIIHAKPFLNIDSLKFLEEIATLYHVSLGSVIKSALPPLQKRKLNKLISDNFKATAKKKIFQKPKLFTYNNLAEKKSYLNEMIAKTGQTLIIIPEAADANQILELLDEQNSISLVTGYLSDKNLFDVWMKIWQGNAKIIIGTRRALFLSFSDLQTIIISETWHPSHKGRDSAPRIHARDAALIAAKFYGSDVHIIGHTPSVEDYFFGQHNVYEIKPNAILPKPLSLNIVDLRREARIKNFSPISHPLEEALQEATKGSIFLYCNRRGSASFVMCRDCSNILKCKKCLQTQTYHESDSKVTCNYCKLSEPMLASCSACDGVNLLYYGKGTESIIKEIKKLMPNDVREIINVEDSELSLKQLNLEKDQIIIGTQLAWSHLNWKKLTLMAFIDADTPLFVPEFRSAEHVWDMIHDAAFRMDGGGEIFIQTSHPEHPSYANLESPKEFYVSELEQRKIFGYPPYRYLLKLFLGAANKESGRSQSDLFVRQLTELTKDSPDIKITPPLELFPPFQNGKYWHAIIVKLAYQNYKQQLLRIIKILPETWKADPNPNTLLSL